MFLYKRPYVIVARHFAKRMECQTIVSDWKGKQWKSIIGTRQSFERHERRRLFHGRASIRQPLTCTLILEGMTLYQLFNMFLFEILLGMHRTPCQLET
jgi:hypothetical protein